MNVLVTGAKGFIAQNLLVHLGERQGVAVSTYSHDEPRDVLARHVAQADFIFHLAGVNRPTDEAEFETGNAGFTQALCDMVAATGRRVGIVCSSSTQAAQDNPYGRSKRRAELILEAFAAASGCPVYLYRLPGVFGKWGRPFYNSVVSTFCHQVANGEPLQVNDPARVVHLAYVDDVVASFLGCMDGVATPGQCEMAPVYDITLQALADTLAGFRDSRVSLQAGHVGRGLERALYSTYISYLRPEQFFYDVPQYADPRGVFVEMLKTPDAGQFSYFSAHPGITRGGHYHHTKTEKFLVVHGRARFRFRHIVTGELYEMVTDASRAQVVETIPGWTHDVTNIGDEVMISIVWANEVFDRQRPDTVISEV